MLIPINGNGVQINIGTVTLPTLAILTCWTISPLWRMRPKQEWGLGWWRKCYSHVAHHQKDQKTKPPYTTVTVKEGRSLWTYIISDPVLLPVLAGQTLFHHMFHCFDWSTFKATAHWNTRRRWPAKWNSQPGLSLKWTNNYNNRRTPKTWRTRDPKINLQHLPFYTAPMHQTVWTLCDFQRLGNLVFCSAFNGWSTFVNLHIVFISRTKRNRTLSSMNFHVFKRTV